MNTSTISSNNAITNFDLFNPINTGNPSHDIHLHYTKIGLRRLDFETHVVNGGRISRIEPDFNVSTKEEEEARIATIANATKELGNEVDAREFVRCLKVIAGEGASAHSLQQIASSYYKRAKLESTSSILKEMGLLAMHLESVTVNEEARVEESYYELERPIDCTHTTAIGTQFSLSDNRSLLFSTAAKVLGEAETGSNLFNDELQFMAVHKTRSHSSKHPYDDFENYFNERRLTAEERDDLDTLDTIYQEEEIFDQYDENNSISLHMSDAERIVACGALDDDIDETCLPEEAQLFASEVKNLYINGAPQSEVYDFIDSIVDFLYSERTKRTTRIGVMLNGELKDIPSTIEVCAMSENRSKTREILEKLYEQYRADFHLNALNSSGTYREFYKGIRLANDITELSSISKDAYKAKEDGSLSLKMFLSLNTAAKVKRWRLESTPMTVTREQVSSTGEKQNKSYVVAQPLLNQIPSLTGASIANFVRSIHELPTQEQERVRQAFKSQNPLLYKRVYEGLTNEILRASVKRLSYFRWACYKQNKPEHPIHLLPYQERIQIWEVLNKRFQYNRPVQAQIAA
jgi:hypothetical protein